MVLVPLTVGGSLQSTVSSGSLSGSHTSPAIVATEQLLWKRLEEFCDKWVDLSKEEYSRAHSTLGIILATPVLLHLLWHGLLQWGSTKPMRDKM
jgi:hypothetical protein